jgi:hypothetical protein
LLVSASYQSVEIKNMNFQIVHPFTADKRSGALNLIEALGLID